MALGDKYIELHNFLKNVNRQEITLLFEEIENILGFKLPESAYKHSAWWSNNTVHHTHALSWTEAGFETIDVTDGLNKKRITFVNKRV